MLTHNAGVWKLRPLPGVVQAVYVSQTQNPVLRQTELFALNNTWAEHNSSTKVSVLHLKAAVCWAGGQSSENP